jgi:RNA polymerase sigma factor for flagellar operon FliA
LTQTAEDARELFLSELERVDRIIAFTCRRGGLSEDESEELRAETHLRLVDDDYRLIREFDGRSELGTYLVVVIQRLMLDFRNQRWGKWRPSAAARRAGTVAVQLETLVIRDGFEFGEAYEILRRNRGVTASREELHLLLHTFPLRHGKASRQRVSMERAQPATGAESVERPLTEAIEETTEDRLVDALRTGLGNLDPEDRLVLRMIYLDGHPISVVARSLGLDQRRLYRRVERLQKALRTALESRGLERDRVIDLLESRRGLQRLDVVDVFRSRSANGSGSGTLEIPR